MNTMILHPRKLLRWRILISMVDANLTSVHISELEETDCVLSGNPSTTEGIHEILHVCEETQLQEDRELLHDVVKRLDLLSQQFEKHRTETSIVVTELLNVCECQNITTQNIPQENISLKELNESLKTELLECKKTITEMNTKLSIADSELASLLTVIRLLNEDRAATSSSKGNKESILPSDAINLKNRFTELQDENEDCGLVRDDDDISLTKVVSFESANKTSQKQGSTSKMMRSAQKRPVLATIDRMMGQLQKLRKKIIIITKQQREILQLY